MRNTIQRAYRLIPVGALPALLFASLAFGQEPAWSGRPDSGWLYVVDSKRNAAESAVLVVDPEKGRVAASLSAGFQPDIAVSPDGSRLYLSYSEKENPSEGKLQVIDTSTGTVLKELPNKNRGQRTHYTYPPNLALSRDGAWLYLFKMVERMEGATYHLEVFDTRLNVFLPDQKDFPDCLSAIMVPSMEADGVFVVCSGTRDVHFVSVDRQSKTLRSSSNIIDVGNTLHEGSGRIIPHHEEAHYVGTGFLNPGGKTFTVITTDGLFLKGDAISGRTIDHGTLDRATHSASIEAGPAISTGWMDDRWVRYQVPVLSPDGKRIYIGLGTAKLLQHGSQLLDKIVVLDASDLDRINNLNPHRTFWSLVISSKGNRLYVVDSDHATISLLDVDNGRELGTVSGVGTTPVYAVVAP